jgi:drug/metabolite transporter (DMT)-like permease
VISTATAAVVLDESVTAVQAVGMAVVLVALAFAVRVPSPSPTT